jgi:hypothetical protein
MEGASLPARARGFPQSSALRFVGEWQVYRRGDREPVRNLRAYILPQGSGEEPHIRVTMTHEEVDERAKQALRKTDTYRELVPRLLIA